ncbi:MAG: type II toxin-antitoxin system HicB family antitoxin [Gammaproteobacteria bacterium]|nr:type II toxin-antitoxin system HicB family antitoxin [Gammaproteobacteria bacterium]MCY4210546.1 type II toxin-antitoxin system HicB family antitoxin [Gammaproteobacteria bacterium]MCY4283404.1 type II toxin-antitoxin system HicB family antitoxin [Gammaproteobacteria bacterium]MCY4339406.1 type II toxin-antitoxin system HicB family antitoxin [Gammaproteobacteria bacterium]
MKYTVILEQGENSFGAHVPDLPGCFAVGATEEEVKKLISEAIAIHVDMLNSDDETTAAAFSGIEIIKAAA